MGNDSCLGFESCRDASAGIGGGSCQPDNSCTDFQGTSIGDNSCNCEECCSCWLTEPGQLPDVIPDNSCNTFGECCMGPTAPTVEEPTMPPTDPPIFPDSKKGGKKGKGKGSAFPFSKKSSKSSSSSSSSSKKSSTSKSGSSSSSKKSQRSGKRSADAFRAQTGSNPTKWQGQRFGGVYSSYGAEL